MAKMHVRCKNTTYLEKGKPPAAPGETITLDEDEAKSGIDRGLYELVAGQSSPPAKQDGEGAGGSGTGDGNKGTGTVDPKPNTDNQPNPAT